MVNEISADPLTGAPLSGSLCGSHGQLQWCGWPVGPAAEPRGVVVIAHGLGEHLGRYQQLAHDLRGAGYDVYALDHQGHGRSDGPRAQLRIAAAVADLDLLITLAAERQPQLPLFLFGHSLGGAIALRYAMRHQDRLRGLALSSPAAALAAGPLMVRLGKLLGRLAPGLPVQRIDSGTLSRDPQVTAAYDADPLNHHGAVPAGTARELLAHVETLPADAATVTLPTLLLYGTADRLCPPRGAIMLSQRLGAGDLTVRSFTGFYHELLNEPDRASVLAELTGWLHAHDGFDAAPAPDTAVTPS